MIGRLEFSRAGGVLGHLEGQPGVAAPVTLNILMNTVFVNNVAVFFATLHRYQVLTSRQAAALYIFLVAAPLSKFICGIIACFDLNHGHEHELLLAWLSVFSHGLVGPHTHG